jgi:putative RNA 2'-phosphotransferase
VSKFLAPVPPPEVLYHGTAWGVVSTILAEGLQPMGRQHVHLSVDSATAVNVARRHGTPIVLVVESQRMHQAGHEFFLSANGVWLTDHVPSTFVRALDLDGRG